MTYCNPACPAQHAGEDWQRVQPHNLPPCAWRLHNTLMSKSGNAKRKMADCGAAHAARRDITGCTPLLLVLVPVHSSEVASPVSDGGSSACTSQAVQHQRRPPGHASPGFDFPTLFESPCMLGTCTLSCTAPATGAGAAPLPVQPGSAAQCTCFRPSALHCIAVHLLGPSIEARWGSFMRLPACEPVTFAGSQCSTAYLPDAQCR